MTLIESVVELFLIIEIPATANKHTCHAGQYPESTANREDFLDAVKEAFPHVDWDKAYKEFRAAEEKA